MCGRTACSLGCDQLVRACRYQNTCANEKGGSNDKSDKSLDQNKNQCFNFPKWKDDSGKYRPNYNQSLGDYLPVLLSESHFEPNCVGDQRILIPMRWGLVPSWFNKDLKQFKMKTINCRLEGIQTSHSNDNKSGSELFKTPLKKGRRCVVLAEGYFEWKKESASNQPYFIYFPQENVDYKNRSSWNEDEFFQDEQWKGPRLLTFAGIYDVNSNIKETDEPLHSVTIITKEAHPKLKWIHQRMPCVLDGDSMVKSWLNSSISYSDALKLLNEPCDNLTWHPVSSQVGNSRNNSIENVLPYDGSPTPKKRKTELLKGQKDIREMFKRK